MKKNLLKKLVCTTLAVSTVVCSGVLMTACTTDHPTVQMTMEFNGESYKLNYKLYRKVAPSTTQHFLELVENGYYDGMCIHNYQTSAWYTGAYTYDENSTDNYGFIEKNYFETVKNYKLTPSVWLDANKETATLTVKGEFEGNGLTVENKPFQNGFGSLNMYYTSKSSNSTPTVYLEHYSDKSGAVHKYENGYEMNSATSLFYINLSSTTTFPTNYCTFAILEEKSKDVLKDLQNDIEKYIADQKEDDDTYSFTNSYVLNTDLGDVNVGKGSGSAASYKTPKSAIVIKTIKVKSY